jgi:hypothetical protein
VSLSSKPLLDSDLPEEKEEMFGEAALEAVCDDPG